MDDVTMYFNPQCSKCRTARGLMEDEGIEAEIVEFLDQPPTVAALHILLAQLGITDPRVMIPPGSRPMPPWGWLTGQAMTSWRPWSTIRSCWNDLLWSTAIGP
jgi:hypothetical protein